MTFTDAVRWTGLDCFQIFAIIWESAQLLFIGIYYALVAVPQHDYVSEILFDNLTYKICMTFFVFVQMVLCGLYLSRFGATVATVLGYVGVACGISGWLALNDQYTQNIFTHDVGLIVFLLGCVFYVFAVMWTMWDMIVHSCAPGHMARNALVYIIIILWMVTIAMALVYLDGALANGIKDSWIPEHFTFMTFTLTHVFIFMLISPNPTRPLDPPERHGDASGGVYQAMAAV